MNPISTELWRKPETVPLSKFPISCHESIRKGLSVIKGEIADDTIGNVEVNELKEGEGTYFSLEDMDILREKLGVNLVHGNYSLHEMKEIVKQERTQNGHSFKKR